MTIQKSFNLILSDIKKKMCVYAFIKNIILLAQVAKSIVVKVQYKYSSFDDIPIVSHCIFVK